MRIAGFVKTKDELEELAEIMRIAFVGIYVRELKKNGRR